MLRLVAGITVVLSLAMAANAETPMFKKGQDYSQVQAALLALGWKGARPAGEKCDSHLCDLDRGEVISCAGTGEAPCLTRWTKENVVINVHTVSDPAVFVELQCLTLCEQDAGGAVQASSNQSQVDDLDELQENLVRAMRLNAERTGRLAASGEAIRAYISAGYVRLKPDSGADYTDYRVVRRPAKLFGQELVVIEEEYPRSKQIGCCVSPGIGVILRITADLAPLKAFASANGCSIDSGRDVIDTLRDLNLRSINGDFVSVSCRERDQMR